MYRCPLTATLTCASMLPKICAQSVTNWKCGGGQYSRTIEDSDARTAVSGCQKIANLALKPASSALSAVGV